MSQAKVNKYKEEKKNRAETIKKEKNRRRIGIAIFAVICAAFIGWFAFSVYDNATRPAEGEEAVATEWDVKSYQDYLSNLNLSYSSSDYTADEADTAADATEAAADQTEAAEQTEAATE